MPKRKKDKGKSKAKDLEKPKKRKATKRKAGEAVESVVQKAGKTDKPATKKPRKKREWGDRVRTLLPGEVNGSVEPVRHGAGQSDKTFVGQPDTFAHADEERKAKKARNKGKARDDREPLSKNKMERFIEGNNELARQPRSYAEDRIRQVLRWLSTAVLLIRPKGVEVQCYYDSNADCIWISTNMKTDNAYLEKLVETEGKEILKFIIKEAKKQVLDSDAHRKRHVDKLAQSEKAARYESQQVVMDCLRNCKIRIPTQEEEKGFHAERRILSALAGQGLDPSHLAGTRRPCLTCAIALEFIGKDGVFPGPLWTSKAATIGFEDPEVFVASYAKHVAECDHIQQVKTHFTAKKEGGYTVDYNTESDSEVEEEEEDVDLLGDAWDASGSKNDAEEGTSGT